MDRNRIWTIGAVLVMAIVLVLGWVVGIQPQLAQVTAANAQRATAESRNASETLALAKLESDFKKLPALQTELASLNASIPSSGDMPAFVDELNALALSTGVTLQGINVSDAQPYTPVAAPVTTAPASTTSGSGSTATPTPTPSPSPSATSTDVATAGVPPVTNALITPTNFAAIPVSLTVSGPYANFLDFVSGLQSASRLYLINTLTSAGSSSTPGTVDGKISGLVYVLLPQTTSGSATAGTTPAAGGTSSDAAAG
jgi:Tfp pilus assembly protein PilO